VKGWRKGKGGKVNGGETNGGCPWSRVEGGAGSRRELANYLGELRETEGGVVRLYISLASRCANFHPPRLAAGHLIVPSE
jgi:hypothetical protein